MQTIPTRFFMNTIPLRRVGDAKIGTTQCTIINDARNEFVSRAIVGEYDRVLWIDSDMVFEPDLMERLSADMDEGMEYVCGLYFKRVFPTAPVIYKELRQSAMPGILEAVTYKDYPKDSIFEIEGSGFGAVMTTTRILKAAWDKYGPPFYQVANLGEDLSFCWRLKEMGVKMYCDSSVKCGHIGQFVFDERIYQKQDVILQALSEPGKDDAV